jgi:hypothetical protein
MYPYQLKLPLAPYRFVWRGDAAVDAEKNATDSYTEERYRHADGTHTVIREYRADGSYHIMSDRGEIELIDNANDPYAPDPVSVVRLPLGQHPGYWWRADHPGNTAAGHARVHRGRRGQPVRPEQRPGGDAPPHRRPAGTPRGDKEWW